MLDNLRSAILGADAIQVRTNFAALTFCLVTFDTGNAFQIGKDHLSMLPVAVVSAGERCINGGISRLQFGIFGEQDCAIAFSATEKAIVSRPWPLLDWTGLTPTLLNRQKVCRSVPI